MSFPSLHHQAHRLAAEGDLAGALALYQQAVAQQGPVAELLLNQASLLWQAYEFAAAGMLHRQLAATPGTPPEILIAAARDPFALGRFADALTLLDAADARRPGDPEILATRAACHQRLGDLSTARELCREALEIQPEQGPALRLLARLDQQEGDPAAAQRLLQGPLSRLAPGSAGRWPLLYEAAAAADALDQPEEAMALLTEAKRHHQAEATRLLETSHRIRHRQWELTTHIHPADWQRWHANPNLTSAPHPPLVLMGGFPRSGTTLLESQLSAHPGCIGTDESSILLTQFTRPIVHEAESTAAAFTELDELDAEAIAAGRDAYFRLTTAFLGEAPGTRLLLDKDPLHTSDLALPLRLFPQAKLLMPLRDPRDVVISFYFTFIPLSPLHAAALTLEETCRFYADTLRHWLHLRPLLPAPKMELRYEDLIADPAATRSRLHDFRGLDPGAATQAAPPRAIRTPTHHAVTRPLHSRAIGRWRRYERWLQPHLPILEPYIRAFGYE